ncbi:MAG: nucleotidyltransferase family protein [Planctomycetaceae bacterium]
MTGMDTRFELERILIQPTATVQDAMASIDAGGRGIALLVRSDGHFIRTITDGDLRRAILAGHAVTTRLDAALDITAVRSITAPVNTPRDEQLALMVRCGVRHLPLLSADGTVSELSCAEHVQDDKLRLQAVIMAGGFGTRLRPLTDDTPKPMLPVGGRPLMERTIEGLQRAGVSRINVTTHYMPEKIIQHFGGGQKFGVELNYVSEDQPLGTAGALRLISEVEEPLLVMNGDILTNIDYRSLLKYHREHDAKLTVALRQYEMQVPYGVVEAKDGVVSELREKPRITFLVNAGIYLLEPSVLRYIPESGRYDMTDLINRLLQQGETVVGFPVMEYWLDIGRLDDFQKAQEDVNRVRWAA